MTKNQTCGKYLPCQVPRGCMVSGVGSLYYSGSMHGSSFLCVYLFFGGDGDDFSLSQDPGPRWSMVYCFQLRELRCLAWTILVDVFFCFNVPHSVKVCLVSQAHIRTRHRREEIFRRMLLKIGTDINWAGLGWTGFVCGLGYGEFSHDFEHEGFLTPSRDGELLASTAQFQISLIHACFHILALESSARTRRATAIIRTQTDEQRQRS
jgi:hypothetical protein